MAVFRAAAFCAAPTVRLDTSQLKSVRAQHSGLPPPMPGCCRAWCGQCRRSAALLSRLVWLVLPLALVSVVRNAAGDTISDAELLSSASQPVLLTPLTSLTPPPVIKAP